MAALNPDFPWKQYLNTIGIAPVKTLNVGVPDFLKALNTTLADTSLNDLKTYFAWQVLNANADLLTESISGGRVQLQRPYAERY